MVSLGVSKESLATKEFPGLTGTPGGQEVARRLAGIFRQGQGGIGGQLGKELLQPAFGPTTEAEQTIIENVISGTQGQSAVRGLGPATEIGLAQNVAPALAGIRQQRVSNLEAALDPFLGKREQDIAGLVGLGELLLPDIISGRKSSAVDFGIGDFT